MKAEIILSSNLPSKTCFVMKFIQKLQKKNFFFELEFSEKKISNAKVLKKIKWDP